jgi:hypothetical protein
MSHAIPESINLNDRASRCAPPGTDRPLVNGNFERGSLAPWAVDTIPGDYYPYGIVLSRDNLNYTSGHKFWARTNASAAGTVPQAERFWVSLRQNMTTCPGRRYAFTGNYFLPHNGVMYPQFHLSPRAEDVSALAGTTSGSELGVWTTIGGSFVASGARVEFTAGVDSRNGGVDGDFYFDKLVVKPA